MTDKQNGYRICAACKWIFKEQYDCPRCGYGSYYTESDPKYYQYAQTQQFWIEKKMNMYRDHLLQQVASAIRE